MVARLVGRTGGRVSEQLYRAHGRRGARSSTRKRYVARALPALAQTSALFFFFSSLLSLLADVPTQQKGTGPVNPVAGVSMSELTGAMGKRAAKEKEEPKKEEPKKAVGAKTAAKAAAAPAVKAAAAPAAAAAPVRKLTDFFLCFFFFFFF